MVNARILLDLQEGFIEIEGPVEFVEKHMSRFLPDEFETAEAGATSSNRKPGRPAKMTRKQRKSNCRAVVDSLVAGKFFNRPRNFTAVKKEVLNAVPECSDSVIRSLLKAAVADGRIKAEGFGRGMKYSRII
ncbi:hypothetical protein Dehly_0395 [Dehalogenimonas lykanthroporepellens BL-DC-9]|jgi:hypothetical protein|nr:hypothetical protein Dehly_0395 [Dehalogenimonas lykanthroporepellens BL-DC-9]